MLIVPEKLIADLVTSEAAYDAVEAVFAAMARGDARNFPVVREALGHADALYGFKSGFDRAGLALGLKSGGYWPGNIDRGLTNHQSTVVLFDPDTGGDQTAGAQGRKGAWHGRRRSSGDIPVACGRQGARLRAGRGLEPASGDAAETGRCSQGDRTAVSGGEP
mgnify:CR=1 FL=1